MRNLNIKILVHVEHGVQFNYTLSWGIKVAGLGKLPLYFRNPIIFKSTVGFCFTVHNGFTSWRGNF